MLGAFERQGDAFLLDDVAVATTWHSIMTPEPGSVVLLAMALFAGLFVRRRKR